MIEKTSTEICADNGWQVGAILKAVERYVGDYEGCSFLITAIGEKTVLGRMVKYRHEEAYLRPECWEEGIIHLGYARWEEAPTEDKP